MHRLALLFFTMGSAQQTKDNPAFFQLKLAQHLSNFEQIYIFFMVNVK